MRLARPLLLGVLLALAAPASAQAVWSAPVTLSAAGQDARTAEVAVDQSGNAVAVWERFGGGTACGGSGCRLVQAASGP